MSKFLKKFFAVAMMSFLFAGAAQAQEWTQVVSTVLSEQSPNYRDVLINNPGVYSEVRLQVLNEGAHIDRFDTISYILWGKSVSDLAGRYKSGEMRTAFMGSSKVKFVRIYARSAHPGEPVRVRVWMR